MIESDSRISHAAENLERIRAERGISYRDLGELAGVPHNTARNFLRGINEPSGSVLLKIADALDVRIDSPAFSRPHRVARKGA